MEWLSEHMAYVLVVFYAAEKVVKLTSTQYDDILIDMIGKVLLGRRPGRTKK